MANALELTAVAQEQILAAVKQTQEIALSGVELWAASVAPLTKTAGQAPIVADLPAPAEIVAASFGFAEKLLASQKEFAEKVVAASAPVTAKRTTAAKA